MLTWIGFILLLFLFTRATLRSRKPINIVSLPRYYLRETLLRLLTPALLLALTPAALHMPSGIAPGFRPGTILLSVIIAIFMTAPLQAFSPSARKDDGKLFFGIPHAMVPGNKKEFAGFVALFLAVVVFEELTARLLLFYYGYTLFGLEGDPLLVLAAIVFAVPHALQGWKGVLGAFVMGCLLGKIFLVTQSIGLCMLLHLFLNGALPIAAWKRLG